MLEKKTVAMNKTIETFYLCKPAVECMQIFVCVVHFLQDTCGSLIYTEADDCKLAEHQNALTMFPAKTSYFFSTTTTWSKCVVFICAISTGCSKPKQTLTMKKNVFLYEAHLTCKSFNLLSVILSLSAEIMCKCTSIDVSLSFHYLRKAVQFKLCFHTCRLIKFMGKM